MAKIELIEIIDPKPDAMIRTFHCAVCDRQHLQEGTLARVWIYYQEGYSSQAALTCLQAIEQKERES